MGHGYTASSIGMLLKACGLRVTSIKIGLCFWIFFFFFGVFATFFFFIIIFFLQNLQQVSYSFFIFWVS